MFGLHNPQKTRSLFRSVLLCDEVATKIHFSGGGTGGCRFDSGRLKLVTVAVK